ncbi:16S rRNA (uracil(1498)-N(3))-methyltransferase [candidate division GN15 bacterium]|nr:16S rRNA (uracil(1498)-N(3))-methyltransferase [candidate division GN15 bacterium]
MQPPLFYITIDTNSPPTDGAVVELAADEAHHAAKVMRLKAGNLVLLVDGFGHGYRAELVTLSAKKASARVHGLVRDFGEPSVRVTLAAGLSAGSKFDSVVQRGTELGVTRFVPLITEKSKVKLDDSRRAKARVTRLTKVAVASMKQCRRSYLPQISQPVTLGEFLADFDKQDRGLIFHPSKAAIPLSNVALDGKRRLSLLVGPESGFSDAEVEAAVQAGLQPVSLGERILRTETAGPVVTALVMHRLGELS